MQSEIKNHKVKKQHQKMNPINKIERQNKDYQEEQNNPFNQTNHQFKKKFETKAPSR